MTVLLSEPDTVPCVTVAVGGGVIVLEPESVSDCVGVSVGPDAVSDLRRVAEIVADKVT